MDYGEGYYIEGQRHVKGRIIMDMSRLYVSGIKGEAHTYIPLEKIVQVKGVRRGIEIKAKLSAANVINVIISLPYMANRKLIKNLVGQLHLKKKFLRRQWYGEAAWR